MKPLKCLFAVLLSSILSSCSKEIYETNEETIYKTGRNQQDDKLLDKSPSRIKIVNSCKTCHGKNGAALNYLKQTEKFLVML